jgi:hypothetical protein
MKVIDPLYDGNIRIRNCIYGLKCDQSWDEMTLTKKENVRFCGNCEKEVFFVEKKGQLLKAIQLNRCVAIDTSISNGVNTITSGYIKNYTDGDS